MLLYLILLLIGIKLKKFVIELFLVIFFLIVYCPDKYKIQIMCDEAVDDCQSALKFISDWFVTSKMIKKLLTALYADDNLLYFNAIFSCNEMDIFNLDVNNINLDDTNYKEDSPETIIHIRLLAWHIKFKKT